MILNFIRIFLFLGLLFSIHILNAQTDFRPGYVIVSPGDTLFGQIDYRGDWIIKSQCRYKGKDGDIISYEPSEINAFRFIDSKYYISKEVDNKPVFLEYLINGKISIYYLRNASGDHYYIDKDGEELTELPYDHGIKYVNNRQVFYETKKHIGILNYYMQDAPEFSNRIADLNAPEHKNLIALAEDYHYAVCKDESCLIYENKQPLFSMSLEAVGGAVFFENFFETNQSSLFQGGLLIRLWMPRTNEKLSFRTGLLLTNIQTDEESTLLYKFPIQMEYTYPKYIVQPKVAFGVNLYHPFSLDNSVIHTVGFMGGFNVALHEMLSLSLNYDIDFIPNYFPLLPVKLMSSSLSAGVLVKIF